MADDIYSSLLGNADLQQYYNSTLLTDPYRISGQAISQYKPNYAAMSPTSGLATSFGQSFLSGLLGNYAQNRAASQVNALLPLLPQLNTDPYSVAAPEGSNEDAFSLLKGNAVLKKQQFDAQEAQLNRKFNLDILGKYLGKEAEIKGEMAGYGATNAATIPGSPQYQANKDIMTEEDSRRKEISMIPSVSQFATMQKSLPLVAGFKDQDTKSSDVGFVYNFIKSLDEGAVRGEEINMANASNPIIQQYKTELQGALTGQSVLTPTLKNKMYSELLAAQGNVYAQAKKDADIIVNIAKQRGVNTANLYPFDPKLSFENRSTQFVEITNPKTGSKLRVPADDPRLKQIQGTPRG